MDRVNVELAEAQALRIHALQEQGAPDHQHGPQRGGAQQIFRNHVGQAEVALFHEAHARRGERRFQFMKQGLFLQSECFPKMQKTAALSGCRRRSKSVR